MTPKPCCTGAPILLEGAIKYTHVSLQAHMRRMETLVGAAASTYNL